MNYKKIIQLKPSDLTWKSHAEHPFFDVKNVLTSYYHTIYVDPFPCASHNVDFIKKKVTMVESIFPIAAPIKYVLLPNELKERVNAMAYQEYVDDKYKKKYKFEGTIALSGKRTIIHPAMSNYLIAHEYGHMVDYWINQSMNQEEKSENASLFRKRYAAFRGIDFNQKLTGYGWKNNIAEVIADDFRIVMAKTDVDFFPHQCGNPAKNKKVTQYWQKLKQKYAI